MRRLLKFARPLAGYSLAALLGYGAATQVPQYWYYLPPVAAKVTGRAGACPWSHILPSGNHTRRVIDLQTESNARLTLLASDPRLPIQQWRLPGYRDFWVPTDTDAEENGKELLSYLLADHRLLDSQWRDQGVQPGDVVIDCGAHVGTFTDRALHRGAATVVAVEPDPINGECLRRNFADEIAASRVLVVSKGAWSTSGKLILREGGGNSGSKSVILNHDGPSKEIDVTTIDQIVQDLGLSHVDFLKLDIEGAEREALAGAGRTLRESRPRITIDFYHLPDDAIVLPRLLRAAHADYRLACGPCDFDLRRAVPHVVFAR